MKINCKDYDSIISNITAAFYGVNVKINDLLLFMESDFVKLSKDIRNYYEQVKIVSDGSRQVSDKILDGGGVEFFKILKQSNDRVSEIKTFCNELYSFLHQGLDDIQHNTKNLHTKFNKLAIFTEESGNTEFANAYRDLSEKLNNVQSEITEITDHIEKVKTMVIDELIQKIDALNGQIQLQEFEHERALDNAKYLDEKVINCIDNIEKLIINIQYHDIIRQKMEHIAAANEDTVDNLQRFSSTLEHSDELECKKYMAILPMVAKIHRNKIEYSKDECEQALNSIMSELKQILEDTTYLSVFRIDFYNYLFYSQARSRAELLECHNVLNSYIDFQKKRLKHLVHLFNELDNTNSKVLNFSSKVLRKVTEAKSSSDLHNNDHIELIHMGNDMFSKKSDVLFQIKKQLSVDKTKLVFEKINKISDLLNAEYGKYTDPKEDERNLFVSEVSSDIKNFIQKIESSSFFNDTIMEISEELIGVHQQLIDNLDEKLSQSIRNELNKLRQEYTMDSEREVHDISINMTDEVAYSEIDNNENEVEFF